MRAARPLVLALLIGVGLGAGAARAECYADYKAKRDGPLRLQYGVAEVGEPCDRRSAARELAPRLAADGWQLLEVMSTFGAEGLEARRESAGAYYLRY